MLKELIGICDERYRDGNCQHCNYSEHCPNHDCSVCLHYIHTPCEAPAPRKYDCTRMADYYVCKYTYKYTSELIYAFERLKDISNKRKLKVMSIGCGPCTDLLALDYLKKHKKYSFENLELRGIDYSQDVWANIHSDIKSLSSKSYDVHFYYQDICNFIDVIAEKNWCPDMITLQYLFSDMYKHSDSEKIDHFIEELSLFINEKLDQNTYIVINDINLSKRFEGGREYFDQLFNKTTNCVKQTCHFNNSNKNRHYEYGQEYPSNDLRFEIAEGTTKYNPFDSCASAQMIIKKVN